jgi:hypothetical protein
MGGLIPVIIRHTPADGDLSASATCLVKIWWITSKTRTPRFM